MGVVYHANYLVWFEVGRTDLLRHAGWTYRDMEADGYSLPVLEAGCHYRQPARYDEELDVRTNGTLLSPVRVQFAYDIMRAADNVILATGHTVHAAVGRDGRPCRLPERVRALFAADDQGPR
jgi:acyl-CoA thioester hydrolase